MPLKERLRRHSRDARSVVVGLALLLALFTVAFYFLQRSRDLPPALVANRVLLFALWYVNVVLILAVVFVLLRNLFKLLVERRARILGSKFKTKLVLTYVGLSLIPVLLLFAISTQLFRGSINRWFSTPLAEILDLGSSVAQDLALQVEQQNQRDAERALTEIELMGLTEPAARPALNQRLQELVPELGLDYLAVYEGSELVHAAISSQGLLDDLPQPGRALLREAATTGKARGRPEAKTAGTLLVSAVRSVGSVSDQPLIVIAGRVLEPKAASASQRLIETAQSYRQLAVQQDDLKASYFLMFLMLTLLILLASTWVGLYLARRVTVPIQALADGTRRISMGDLEHPVEASADDELGVLVTSFNRMTAELKSNRAELERGNHELEETNLRLRDERALIAAVLENVAAGVISFDDTGRILTCNGAALAMLRQRESEVVGKNVSEAWSDAGRSKLASLVASLGRGRERAVHQVQMVLDGEWKSFEVKLTSTGEAGTVSVMVLEELTELVKAQQLAAWREAARRIAHEIKNPLTPIQLAAERVLAKYRRGDGDLGRALEEGVEIIGREVRTLQGMVDEFSRYARMPQPQPAETDLAQLFTDTLQLYRNLKPGVVVEHAVSPEVGRAWLDPEQIRRVVINLVDNALEATAAPGRVAVSASRDGELLRIEVADTGRGIPPEDKDKLFLPYFSTKGRGTGLGLAIVHRIVTDHHGRITVEDQQPRGTVFKVELPAYPGAVDEA